MENREVLLAANAAVMEGDNEGFLAFCTDEVVWTFVGEQTLVGKEAVRQYMAETYLESPKFDVQKMISADDHVTAVGKIKLKDSHGNLISYSYCDIWRFENGKMAELTAFVIEIKE